MDNHEIGTSDYHTSFLSQLKALHALMPAYILVYQGYWSSRVLDWGHDPL